MEAVDILDQIFFNYDSERDDFTMDPAALQDELLRLAQQLQIVVPAHNNLLGGIPFGVNCRLSARLQAIGGLRRRAAHARVRRGARGTTWILPRGEATPAQPITMHVYNNSYVGYIDQAQTQRGTRRRGSDVQFNSLRPWRTSSLDRTTATDSARQMRSGCSSGGNGWRNIS